MKRIYSLIPILCLVLCSNAQGTWTQKANFGGVARAGAASFVVGTKAYVGTGDAGSGNYVADFWEWDQSSNSWSQKANFPGQGRRYCFAFDANGKGYMGTGEFSGFIKQNDFYEYDPSTNTWLQKANFPGTARTHAKAFTLGNKGYVGTGFNNANFNDFYEYDPSSNVWTTKANFPGAARYGTVAFNVGNLGYMGMGTDGSAFYSDFYEYNASTNSWIQRANFGGGARNSTSGFGIGTKGFAGTGYDVNSVYYQDFWEWDQASNTWTQRASVGGNTRSIAIGLSIGALGYIGTGSGPAGRFNDYWEYAPCTSPSQPGLITGPTTICAGTTNTYSINTVSGATSYTWVLPSGWTGTSSTTSINATASTTSGNVTVTANNACGASVAQTLFVTVNNVSVSTMVMNALCNGQCNGNAMAMPNGTGPFTYLWNPTGQTTQTATGLCANTYTVTVTGALGCSALTTATITQPTVVSGTTSQTPALCNGSSNGSATVIASGGTPGYSYNWAPGGGTNATATGLGAGTYTVTIIDANGCTGTQTITVTQPTAITSTTSQTNVLCNGGNSGTATVIASGGTPNYTYNWSPSGGTNATGTGLSAGPYTVTITDMNGCTHVAAVTITEPSAIAASASASQTVICSGICTNLTASVSGGTPPYSYLWIPGNQTSSAISACPTNSTPFTCTVTDANGCTQTAGVTVIVNPLPTVFYMQSPMFTCVNWNPITLSTGNPGGGTYSGTAISGNQFSPSFAGVGTFIITYSYTDGNGCTGSDTSLITVNACAGVDEINSENGLQVSPNPFTSECVFSFTNDMNFAELRLFDVLGNEIRKIPFSGKEVRLPREDLSNGIYFFRISADDKLMNTGKLIIE